MTTRGFASDTVRTASDVVLPMAAETTVVGPSLSRRSLCKSSARLAGAAAPHSRSVTTSWRLPQTGEANVDTIAVGAAGAAGAAALAAGASAAGTDAGASGELAHANKVGPIPERTTNAGVVSRHRLRRAVEDSFMDVVLGKEKAGPMRA
jgi:LPXTG-motif cell wall-anchored protein